MFLWQATRCLLRSYSGCEGPDMFASFQGGLDVASPMRHSHSIAHSSALVCLLIVILLHC